MKTPWFKASRWGGYPEFYGNSVAGICRAGVLRWFRVPRTAERIRFRTSSRKTPETIIARVIDHYGLKSIELDDGKQLSRYPLYGWIPKLRPDRNYHVYLEYEE